MKRIMSRAGINAMAAAGAALVLVGCAETQLAGAVVKEVSRNEIPSGAGGIWKVGTPYQIAGVWYYPKEDTRYDNTGIASWYGPQFHRRKTANGEIFDMHKVSAAHPTLPMPVMVRVTNLENGRSLIVRVNDRGPFARGREIDMSMRAAELLGFKEQGTAKVRVQYLARADEWRGEQGVQVAEAAPPPGAAQAASAVMAPVADDAAATEEDDDDSGLPIATAGLPPAPGAPVNLALLAGGAAPAAAGAIAPAAAPATPATAQAGQGAPAMAPVVDNFFVQAGSFRSAGNANALASRLSDLGPVEVTETVVDGTPWYRVRVGPVDSSQGADTLLESVISRGQDGARVVIN